MRYIFLAFILFSFSQAFGQRHAITGTVRSAEDNSTLPGATVLLLHSADSTNIGGVITDLDGNFRFEDVKPGDYLVKVQFIGFQGLRREIAVEQDSEGDLSLGVLRLREETTTLQEVVVTAKSPTGQLKGDTTSFNASAYKTLPDASSQDLVEKLPGITVQDGNLQAQGENVVQILVDGKPFFGTDVNAALQNLPAEVIDRIEVFDKKSDKAELSGFDDGEREKTINIVTKPNRRKGQFGKGTIGYGTDDRYLVGASVNFFNEDRRITVTGLSNNINAVNYSADANSQGEVRTQNGIINTNSLGINFNDSWGDKVELSGSYMFSNRSNEGITSLVRNYILPSDSGQVYTENSRNTRTNRDHYINMRFEYNIDSNNRILIRPRVSLRHDENSSYFTGETDSDHGMINETENRAASDNSDYDFDYRMYYSRRFSKRGRSLTVGGEVGYHSNEDLAWRRATNIYYREETEVELLNQRTTRDRTGLSWDAEISYTEPVGKKGQVELEYELSNRINDSDKLTYDVLEQEVENLELDTALSNTFKSEYFTQEAEIGYQYSSGPLRIQVEGQYQIAKLDNDQQFPDPFLLERSFNSFLPTFRLDYEFSRTKNLEIDYDTWTSEPSIGQLQSVIDNSNPLHLRTGNPNLDQSYHNRIRLRYRGRNLDKEQNFFVYMAASAIQNNIANSTTIARETTLINDEVVLEKGSQLSRPVNVDGYWDFRSYFSFGRPLNFIKSNLGLNASVNYTRRPGIVNEQVNYVNSTNLRAGFSLSSNISEKIDFNFSTRGAYNIIESEAQNETDNNYYSHSTGFRLDWIIWEGFVFRTNLRHQLNTNLAYDNSFFLINMSLGKKIFANQRGEISLNVYDLLAQNTNVWRNVTELYTEDVQSNALERYLMLTFTYNLRHFSKGTTIEDYEKLHSGEERRR